MMRPPRKERICNIKDIPNRGTIKFSFKQGDQELEGFCVRIDKQIIAYLNECAHLPMAMDWDDNDFFTEDKKHLFCKTHGAVYNEGTIVGTDYYLYCDTYYLL